jgi:hypothetical protein
MINSLRSIGIALALVVILLQAVLVHAADPSRLVVAFEEESIPAADLGSPSPAASPSPSEDSNSGSDTWQKVPTTQPPASAAQASPTGFQAVSTAPPGSPAIPQAAPTAADIPPAMDIGSLAATPQISDSSLEPLIQVAPTPARAASLRITEKQRVELERGHVDDAIRELEHAVSIDPSNSYAYFYLGRAYVARKGYAQALTFFKRAEIGLASNSAWLGETYAFEGVSLEESGKSNEAEAAYQKALAATPGNLTARVGATRLAAFAPGPPAAAPVAEAAQPAPDADEPPPAPDEAPPPPAPASAPSSAGSNND